MPPVAHVVQVEGNGPGEIVVTFDTDLDGAQDFDSINCHVGIDLPTQNCDSVLEYGSNFMRLGFDPPLGPGQGVWEIVSSGGLVFVGGAELEIPASGDIV